MKRFFYITVIIFVLLSLLSLPVYAIENHELTGEDAEKLISALDQLYWKLQNFPEGTDVEMIEFGEMMPWGGYLTAALCRTEYSYADLLEESRAIYADDIAKEMLALTKTMYYVDGEVLLTSLGPQWDPYNINGEGLSLSGINESNFRIDATVTMKSDTEALIEFNYVHIEHPYEDGACVKRSSVTSVLENGEWRISGGDYINLLAEYHSGWPIIYPDTAPQTGINVSFYLLTALISVVSAALLRKRFS